MSKDIRIVYLSWQLTQLWIYLINANMTVSHYCNYSKFENILINLVIPNVIHHQNLLLFSFILSFVGEGIFRGLQCCLYSDAATLSEKRLWESTYRIQ